MKIIINKNMLKEEYINNGKSILQIAKETGYKHYVLYRLFDKYDIKKRPAGKNSQNYTNKKFGQWLVKKKHPTKQATWICQCSCGIEKPVNYRYPKG